MTLTVWKSLTRGLFLLVLIRCVECQTSFIGYYLAPDSTQALNAGEAWTTSGTYAGDCARNGKCALATDCQEDILYYDNDSTLSCSNGLSCVSMTIFQTFPNGMPSAMNYDCRAAWLAYTVYRELEASTTSSSSILSPSSSRTSRTSIARASATHTSMTTMSSLSITAAPQSTISAPSSTNTNKSFSHKTQSKAWIAGPIVGGVAIIVLLIIGALWWRRRHSSRKSNPYAGHELPSNDKDYKELPVVAYKHVEEPVELWAARDPSEM